MIEPFVSMQLTEREAESPGAQQVSAVYLVCMRYATLCAVMAFLNLEIYRQNEINKYINDTRCSSSSDDVCDRAS